MRSALLAALLRARRRGRTADRPSGAGPGARRRHHPERGGAAARAARRQWASSSCRATARSPTQSARARAAHLSLEPRPGRRRRRRGRSLPPYGLVDQRPRDRDRRQVSTVPSSAPSAVPIESYRDDDYFIRTTGAGYELEYAAERDRPPMFQPRRSAGASRAERTTACDGLLAAGRRADHASAIARSSSSRRSPIAAGSASSIPASSFASHRRSRCVCEADSAGARARTTRGSTAICSTPPRCSPSATIRATTSAPIGGTARLIGHVEKKYRHPRAVDRWRAREGQPDQRGGKRVQLLGPR